MSVDSSPRSPGTTARPGKFTANEKHAMRFELMKTFISVGAKDGMEIMRSIDNILIILEDRYEKDIQGAH